MALAADGVERSRPGRRSSARLRGVDGLRAVAASSVLVYHVWRGAAPDGQPMRLLAVETVAPHLRHGVTLFFVLSGFLLFRPFASAAIRNVPLPRFRSYLVNRALRILPAYWVILVAIGLVLDAALVRGPGGGLHVGQIGLGNLLVCAALIQNYSESTLFTGIAPAWSLAAEATWYLALPLLALLAARAAAGRRSDGQRAGAVLLPVVLMVAIGFTGKLAALRLVDWSARVETTLWGTADFFAYGMIVAVVSIELERGRLRLPPWWRSAAVAAMIAISVVVVLFGATNLQPGGGGTYASNFAMALVCALLVALVVLPHDRLGFDTPVVRLLDSRVFAAVGVASYSLFLWHEPLALWLREHGLTEDGWLGLGWNLLLVCVISGALSALTYRAVERPALHLRRTWAGRPEPPPEQVHAAP